MSSPENSPIDGTPTTRMCVLMVTDLVDSTKIVERVGDEEATRLFRRIDRVSRDLLATHAGLEIDKTDGFLFLFERSIDAVSYSLSYHDQLADLSKELNVELSTRVGIHLGEVVTIRNSKEDVARGAKPLEVEGLAKPMAARIMSLAQGGQTLMTASAYELSKRAARGRLGKDTLWVEHGEYILKGVANPINIFEVGKEGSAPLTAPPDSEKVWRVPESTEPTSGSHQTRTIAMVILILLIAGFAWMGSRAPETTASLESEEPTARIQILSTPTGASIRQGDLFLGQTPVEFEMDGAQTASFTALLDGHENTSFQCELSDEEGIPCVVTLNPIQQDDLPAETTPQSEPASVSEPALVAPTPAPVAAPTPAPVAPTPAPVAAPEPTTEEIEVPETRKPNIVVIE